MQTLSETRTEVAVIRPHREALLVTNGKTSSWIKKKDFDEEDSTVLLTLYNQGVKDYERHQAKMLEGAKENVLDMSSVTKETEKALMFSVNVYSTLTRKVSTRRLWLPKSILVSDGENYYVPFWIAHEKEVDLINRSKQGKNDVLKYDLPWRKNA